MCVRKRCQRRRRDREANSWSCPHPAPRLTARGAGRKTEPFPYKYRYLLPLEAVMEQTQRCWELPASAELPSWGRQVFCVSRPPRWLQSQGGPVPRRDLVPQIHQP